MAQRGMVEMLQLRYGNSSKPPVWLVAPQYIIGSEADCDCVVSGDGVLGKHVTLVVNEEVLVISKLDPKGFVSINGVPLVEDTELKHGDNVTIGSAKLDIFDPKLLRNQEDWLPASDGNDDDKVEWSLLAMNSALGNRRFLINGQILLGRSKDCDVSLAVSHLSRKHARLSATKNGLLVEDLQSSNGTFVNGKRVQKTYLKAGDELGFDTLKFKICCSEDDEEKTFVRPALKEKDVKISHAKVNKINEQKQVPLRSQTPSPINKASASQEFGDNSAQLIVGVILVIIILVGLAWFLLI